MLSIIIPTLNRVDRLELCLEEIVKQSLFGQSELIVIDNGSSDSTRELCNEFVKQYQNFRYIFEDRPGLHTARHRGASEAKGDILVYGDDDIIPSQSWLDGIMEGFKDPEVGLLGGPILPLFEETPPLWVNKLWKKCEYGQYLYQFSVLDFGERDLRVPYNFIFGCNFSIRKKLVYEAGGFHPDALPKGHEMYRGDGETPVAEYVERSGHKVIYHHNAGVKHWVSKERMTVDYIYKRAFLEGISTSFKDVRKAGNCSFRLMVAAVLKRLLSTAKLITVDNRVIKKAVFDGFWKGYFSHLREVRDKPALEKWVLKEKYY